MYSTTPFSGLYQPRHADGKSKGLFIKFRFSKKGHQNFWWNVAVALTFQSSKNRQKVDQRFFQNSSLNWNLFFIPSAVLRDKQQSHWSLSWKLTITQTMINWILSKIVLRWRPLFVYYLYHEYNCYTWIIYKPPVPVTQIVMLSLWKEKYIMLKPTSTYIISNTDT